MQVLSSSQWFFFYFFFFFTKDIKFIFFLLFSAFMSDKYFHSLDSLCAPCKEYCFASKFPHIIIATMSRKEKCFDNSFGIWRCQLKIHLNYLKAIIGKTFNEHFALKPFTQATTEKHKTDIRFFSTIFSGELEYW